MTALWLAAACSSTAVAQDRKDYPPCEAYQSIGVAHMDADGVITLYIRTLPPGPTGEGELHYAPDDPRYQEISHTWAAPNQERQRTSGPGVKARGKS
jgi:hypothetical protein